MCLTRILFSGRKFINTIFEYQICTQLNKIIKAASNKNKNKNIFERIIFVELVKIFCLEELLLIRYPYTILYIMWIVPFYKGVSFIFRKMFIDITFQRTIILNAMNLCFTLYIWSTYMLCLYTRTNFRIISE